MVRNALSTLIVVAGLIAVVLIWGLFTAVGAVFGLLATQPFLLGLAAGVGGSVVVGRRMLRRLYQLERRNRELEQALDRLIYPELAG